jgi:penicillin-binding protein 1A
MDDFTSLGNLETGARAALPIWIDFMAATRRPGEAALYFDIPNNMRKIPMDPVTGRAVTEGNKGAVKALFISGTEPDGK